MVFLGGVTQAGARSSLGLGYCLLPLRGKPLAEAERAVFRTCQIVCENILWEWLRMLADGSCPVADGSQGRPVGVGVF